VRSAKTRLKSDALKEKPREARNEPNYSPVHPEGAEFRVRRLELKVPPHRLEEMILRGSVLLAEQRKHIDLPAAVMDEPAEGPRGAKLRISSMSIRRGRSNRPDTMSMSIEWEQNKQVGPALRDFVFVDKVFALDKEGRIIGGGRWNRGDPLNESGTFKFDIDLPASQACQTIRVDMVTKYSEQDFDLTIEDIFDPRER
ncbi:MAG: hypothetical protein MI741_03255, partial [Rhodospirillales bacterium]|nr:hypothetical protein [Rhodospirillales bacterium]